jgi:thymidylate synthase
MGVMKISLYPLLIRATTIEDAWFRCLYLITAKKGDATPIDPNGELGWSTYAREYMVQLGSFQNQQVRREFHDVTLHLSNPSSSRADLNTSRGLLPHIPETLKDLVTPPADSDYVDTEYLSYLLTGLKQPTEDYTYGERFQWPTLRLVPNTNGKLEIFYVDYDTITTEDGDLRKLVNRQRVEVEFPNKPKGLERVLEIPTDVKPMEAIIDIYRNGHFDTNQATMAVGMPTDISLRDPPCLRLVDTRVMRNEDGTRSLHFRMYFRSWDLWAGLPPNLAGLQMMKEHMVYMINDGKPESEQVKDGEMIVSSKGLHLYGYQFDWANSITHRTPSED